MVFIQFVILITNVNLGHLYVNFKDIRSKSFLPLYDNCYVMRHSTRHLQAYVDSVALDQLSQLHSLLLEQTLSAILKHIDSYRVIS